MLVKFADDSGVFVTSGGALKWGSGSDLSRVAAILYRAGGIEPMAKLPLEVLDRWHRLADAGLPAGQLRPGHLARWVRVRIAPGHSAEDLVAALREEAAITSAYIEPEPVLAGLAPSPPQDLPPPTPDFTSHQVYRAPAPSGFGVDATHGIYGARGETVRFYHVEDDWFAQHEDLESVTNASFLGGVTSQNTPGANHGTGVIGCVVASRNGYGMTGLADLATARLVNWSLNGGVPDAITAAIAEASPGDVITLVAGYNLRLVKPDDYVPIEYFQAPFDVILTGTALGVVVIEAALNGDNDLDDPRFSHRFDLGFRDSGAILVGATDGPALVRASFSNYGSRIDCNGWGGQVATIGYGDLWIPNQDVLQAYSQGYAGTSAATALTTGLLVSLQGVAERQLGRRLSPLEIRGLLRNHGTAVPGEIGRRPDLVAILGALGLPDALSVTPFDVALGGSLTFDMSGAPGGGFALSMALHPADLDVGLGRHLHLDPAWFVPITSFALPTGTATWTITVPNDPSLRDLDLFFQGVVVDTHGVARLSSSHDVHLH